MKTFKVAVIGGGPGGYTAGIRLSQYGIPCVVIEKARLGGVCLNWGCIPTKALVKVADTFQEIKNMEKEGILNTQSEIDYSRIYERKNNAVEKLVSGIEFLYKKRKIDLINSKALKIRKNNGLYEITTETETVKAEYIILATGSKPRELPNLKFDHDKILSSKDVLNLQELPKTLAVVGGGVIGSEFASIFQQLGVKVTMVEFLPSLISVEDKEIGKRLQTIFKKRKMKLHLKTAVESIDHTEDGLSLNLSSGKELLVEKALISIGRAPVCDIEFADLDLEKNKNYVTIDNQMRTNLKNIFAVGDVTGKLMLAHVASAQAMKVVDIINNELNEKTQEFSEINYANIPRCTFTNPGIGSVGLTEDEAKEIYPNIITGKFMFSANGKALASGTTEGFAKAVFNADDHKLLGMHIIGPEAAELIAQGAAMIGLNADLDGLKNIVYAHPTLSEAVGEAIEDVEDLAIHKI